MSSPNTRVWFVTGCSSGFGRSLAEQILQAGDYLVATARRPESLYDLLARAPERVRVFPLDVTDPDQIRATVHQAATAFGRLDVVVNNAGYGLVGALEEYSDDQIERNFETNLMGPLRVMRAALPVLRAQGSGHIINMSAIAGFANEEGFSVYGAAKFALEGASEAVRGEVAPLGIKVTIVEPGPFRTDFIGRSLERGATRIREYDATSGKFLQFLERIEGRQPGDPVKAADAIIQMVHQGQAPTRLVLGRYAVKRVRDKVSTLVRELEDWEHVSVTTDFEAN